MAFLAVLREGLETAVFLLAAFNASGNGLTAGLGALLGILVAALLGYGIYRGGVRINLSKFFRATGLVLVVVAAGLVMTALHTAHEAGWLNSGQDRLFDISWLVRNGSVQASLITGVLGIQPMPTVIEVVGWLRVSVAGRALRRLAAGPAGAVAAHRWSASGLAVACAAAPSRSPSPLPPSPQLRQRGQLDRRGHRHDHHPVSARVSAPRVSSPSAATSRLVAAGGHADRHPRSAPAPTSTC